MGKQDSEKVTLREEAATVTSQHNTSVDSGAVDGISGQASTPGEADGIHIARGDDGRGSKSYRPVTETKEHGKQVAETK